MPVCVKLVMCQASLPQFHFTGKFWPHPNHLWPDESACGLSSKLSPPMAGEAFPCTNFFSSTMSHFHMGSIATPCSPLAAHIAQQSNGIMIHLPQAWNGENICPCDTETRWWLVYCNLYWSRIKRDG